MKKDIDELLKQALTPTEEPNFWLNQNILNQVKETSSMDNRKLSKRIPAAALAAAVILGAGSVTAYAAWKYLSPEEVSQHMEDRKLAEAFQSKDAVLVDEQQDGGGFQVTLLGIVSGKDLTKYQTFNEDGSVRQDRTYIVTAIEYADGTPMPDRLDDDVYADMPFFVSPLIKGYQPWQYNAVTMGGGYQQFAKDGVLYRLTECDNVEIFADQGLYLCVLDQTFYDTEAYHYNEKTGEITRNEAYEGLNALFDLPVDPAKADQQAAAEYLAALEEEHGQEEDGEENTQPVSVEEEWMEKITPDNISQYAKRVEQSVQVLEPDEKGAVSYQYEIGERSGKGTQLVSSLFPDQLPGMSDSFSYSSDGTVEGIIIDTFQLNEDGTVTYAAYIPK